VTQAEENAVVKLVRKVSGADRELLFVDLGEPRNVVPVIDSGEYREYWALVMPRADRSLRTHLNEQAGPLDIADALVILKDICDALVDLDGKVVHRDLKPENAYFLPGDGASQTSASPVTRKPQQPRIPESSRSLRLTPPPSDGDMNMQRSPRTSTPSV